MTGKDNINKQSVSAVKWSALGSIAQYGLSLGAQIVLARLLGPENYGLFAMGLIVLTFSNFLSNFGFAWGLIQIQNLTTEDIRFAFTWQLISGGVVAAALYVFAPEVADYFKEPRVEPIVRWLSVACVISAITAPASNLLRRNLDFRWINIIQIISYAIAYLAIGIPMAYCGFGVWSLVAAWLAQAIIMLIMSFIRYPHSIKLLFWYAGAKSMSGVGLTVFVTNLCNWVLDNIDRILLGRFLDSHAVGLYSVGYNLASTPNKLLIGALQPAFLTAGAKFQSEPERLRRVFLPVIASVWVLITPLFALFAIIAHDLVGFLYGDAWQSTAVVLAILALSMPVYITWAMSTPILWNTKGKHLESLLQLPIIVLAGWAFYTFAHQGVVVVALVAAGILCVRALVITTAACQRLKIGVRHLSPSFARGWAMTLLVTFGSFAGVELGEWVNTLFSVQLTAMSGQGARELIARASQHILPLAGGILLGCGVFVVVLQRFSGLLGHHVLGMLARFSPRFVSKIQS
ncbi:lipopolysaccharide biosynthesis protein [Crenothrix polyspora]|uniref:Polysaccharide biosynthesis protein n=1 Tax=Crenothrix polyspora TaxID=360316 RepID=A0A1R4HEW8_9GAMM|nr:lipopolysaccharide biosynthesis protein [Crenothrix polyspora]SJM94581.1 Polysaccharide biosynthesis protein [Crenothrix polyspora]